LSKLQGSTYVYPAPGHPTGLLRRGLGLWGATAFVVTSMVGTGIFTVPAFVRSATGNGLTALGVWLVGAVLALCGALCYAELATRMPRAGGEYQYLSRVYGPMWGFVSGWITFFVGFAAPTAASALGAVAYLEAVVPGWNSQTPLVEGFGLTQGAVLAALLPLAFAVWHSLGVRPSGRLQSTLMLTTIVSIALFVVAGLLSGRGNWQGVAQSSTASGSWWVALIQVSFAYTGWNGATYLAGEIANPRRNLPRALIGGTLIVVGLYLALNLLFLYALPAHAWQPDVAVGKDAAERLFGTAGGRFVSAIIAFTIIGSISAWTAAGPRVYFAMAYDGLAPAAFKRLGQTSQAPIVALFAQAGVAALLALTNAFDVLLIYVGSGLLLFSGFTIAAVYVLRHRDRVQDLTHFRVPGYPYTPAVFLVLVGISCLQSFQESPVPTGAALLTLVAGFAIYFIGRLLGWFKADLALLQHAAGSNANTND
jgi:basic amino acid/polyamine antiporter, APA family